MVANAAVFPSSFTLPLRRHFHQPHDGQITVDGRFCPGHFEHLLVPFADEFVKTAEAADHRFADRGKDRFRPPFRLSGEVIKSPFPAAPAVRTHVGRVAVAATPVAHVAALPPPTKLIDRHQPAATAALPRRGPLSMMESGESLDVQA